MTARANEGSLSTWPYFRTRLAAVRYGTPVHSTVVLKYEDIQPEGGNEVLAWVHGKPLAECMKVPSHRTLETHIAQMWNAACKWELSKSMEKNLDWALGFEEISMQKFLLEFSSPLCLDDWLLHEANPKWMEK